MKKVIVKSDKKVILNHKMYCGGETVEIDDEQYQANKDMLILKDEPKKKNEYKQTKPKIESQEEKDVSIK